MTQRGNLKGAVTKLKNKINNRLHEVEVDKLIYVAKALDIRVNPELLKIIDVKTEPKDQS